MNILCGAKRPKLRRRGKGEVITIKTNGCCTVYRKRYDGVGNSCSYSKIFVPRAMIQRRAAITAKGGGMVDKTVNAEITAIFIPAKHLPSDFVIETGDVIICCESELAANEQDFAALLRLPEALTVMTVLRRDFGSNDMQHYEVRCGR